MMQVVPFAAAHVADLLTWFPTEADLVRWGGGGVRFPLDAGQFAPLLQPPASEPPGHLGWTGLIDGQVCAHAEAWLDHAQGVGRLARVGLAPTRRGHGLAVPFLRQVLDRVWAHSAIQRIELNVYPSNAAAIATYAHLGFMPEGVRRAATPVGHERWDMAMFGLLRDGVRGTDGIDAKPTGCQVAADAYPLSPLEAWYVMRGFMVRPAGGGLTVERFLDLPGKLELSNGYVLLWNA